MQKYWAPEMEGPLKGFRLLYPGIRKGWLRKVARKAKIEKWKATPRYVNRHRNRCHLCGRPRAYIRYFGLCRICFRTRALKGEIPGVRKASW